MVNMHIRPADREYVARAHPELAPELDSIDTDKIPKWRKLSRPLAAALRRSRNISSAEQSRHQKREQVERMHERIRDAEATIAALRATVRAQAERIAAQEALILTAGHFYST